MRGYWAGFAPWGNGGIGQQKVNEGTQYAGRGILLKDVRDRFNVWCYLRPGFLGNYFLEFERLFFLRYDDYVPAGDSDRQFARRLAAQLEEVEPEYLARYRAIDGVINPFVNLIMQREGYELGGNKTQNYGTTDTLSDRFNSSETANINFNVNGSMSDTHTIGQSMQDKRTDSLTETENQSDVHDSSHVLSRNTDSPQDANGLGVLPVGWQGKAPGPGGGSGIEGYVPLPWNENYLTTANLNDTVQDTRQTSGTASVSDVTEGTRASEAGAVKQTLQGSESQQGNTQARNRDQQRFYAGTNSTLASISDRKDARQEYGLQGKTVGEVWAEWNAQVKVKNVTRDLLDEVKRNFILVY